MAIRIEIYFDDKTLDREIEKVKTKTENELSAAGTSAGTRFATNFGTTFSNNLKNTVKNTLATIGTLFAAQKIGGFLSDAIQETRQFQLAIAEVNTILGDNKRLTEDNAKTFRAFSRQYGTSAQRQVKSFYQIISAGVTDTTQAFKLLNQANKLSIGGLAGVESSINILTDIINVYKDSGLTAQEATDSLFQTVKLGKTTISELSSSLGTVLSPAKEAGIELDVINAALATLTTRGNSTSENVTELNSLISSLSINATLLGKGFDITAVQTDGFATVLQRLQDKTKGSSIELFKLLGRKEAVLAFQKLSGDGFKSLGDNISAFTRKAGAASDAFKIIEKSADFQFKKLDSSVKDLQLSLGKLLIPSLLRTTRSLNTFFNLFAKKPEGTAVDKINRELTDTGDRVREITARIESLNGIDLSSKFSFRAQAAKDELKKLNKELITVKDRRAELRKELSKVFKARNSAKEEETNAKIRKESMAVEIADTKALAASIKGIGLSRTQALKKQLEERQVLLYDARQAGILTEEDYEARVTLLQNEYREQRRISREQEALDAKASFASIGEAFVITAQNIKVTAGTIAKTMHGILVNGIGNAFTRVGQALKNGENGFAAFGEAFKGIFGDVASAAGDLFIKLGVASLATGNIGMGTAQIAAGGALKILSGILGSSGGSSAPASAGGAEGAPSTVDNTGVLDSFTRQERQADRQVNITVQGSLVQQEELGLYLEEVLNDTRDKNGTVSTNVRTA